jgi:hypothetical protein
MGGPAAHRDADLASRPHNAAKWACRHAADVSARDVGDIEDTAPGNESPTKLRGHVSYIDDTPSTHSR